MEYKLIEWHDDGVVRATATYRGANPSPLALIEVLTEALEDAIVDWVKALQRANPDLPLMKMVVTHGVYAAEVRIDEFYFPMLAGDFNAMMRKLDGNLPLKVPVG